MKKSVKVRVICLAVAVVVLTGAVAAAAVLGSPYETIKNALLDALTFRNATAETHITMSVNGVLTEESRSYDICGDYSTLSYNFDDDGNIRGFRYYTDNLHVYPEMMTSGDGMDWYYVQLYPNNNYYRTQGGDFTMFTTDNRNSAQMRFFELLVDALVGDLKNNITMTSENGIRYIRGTLTETQIPELIKAGIDVIVEQSGNYYFNVRDVSFDGGEYIFEHISILQGIKNVAVFRQPIEPLSDEDREAWDNGTYYDTARYDDNWGIRFIGNTPYLATGPQELINEYSEPATRADYGNEDNPLNLPMQSLVVNYVRGEAEVDADGNLLNLKVSGTATVTNVFGEVSVVELNATARFSDIGTSSPVCPIPGVEDFFTEDYMKARFGTANIGVYFKLNKDGSINEESITTAYPGELIHKNFSFAQDQPAKPQAAPQAAPQAPLPSPVPYEDPVVIDDPVIIDEPADED